mgnify:CR=1 FL=1
MSLPVTQRAGHRVNHAVAVKVYDRRLSRFCGFLDPSQRLYQWGGQLAKNVYWKRRLVPLGLEEWAQIKDAVDLIEFIDDETKCYRVDMATARRCAETFDGGKGLRVGIPLDAFDLYDAEERLVQPRAAKYRDKPEPEPVQPAPGPAQMTLL